MSYNSEFCQKFLNISNQTYFEIVIIFTFVKYTSNLKKIKSFYTPIFEPFFSLGIFIPFYKKKKLFIFLGLFSNPRLTYQF